MVNLGRGKEDPAKIRRSGRDLILGFEDAESAKEAIVEIAANKTIAVHGARGFGAKKMSYFGGVKKALDFAKFNKRAK